MKFSFIIVFCSLIFLRNISSCAQDYTLRSYFNDELLTNSELSIFYDAPLHGGWCDYKTISKLNIPHHNLYLVWDTLRLSPFEFNMLNYNDTFVVDFKNDKNFQMPVKGLVKNNFGFGAEHFNYGVDISCPAGDTVINPFSGIVRVAKSSRSFGNVVVIRNKNGTETIISNLAVLFVKTNQIVNAGEIIGTLKYPENNFFIKSLKRLSSKKEIPMSYVHFELRFLGQALDVSKLINFQSSTLLDAQEYKISKSSFSYLEEIRKYISSHKKEHKKQGRYR